MTTKTIIETIGTIEKKEKVSSINEKRLVLETHQPFPGYHGERIPDKLSPRSVFLIIKSKYGHENIVRKIQKIKKNNNLTFDGTPGNINIFNKQVQCIRLKGLKNYLEISKIISIFEDNKIFFMKNKKIDPYESLIKIAKYFILEEIENKIYQDMEIPEIKYFEIPSRISWANFEKITLDIKRNIEFSNWDAAIGSFYRKYGLVDMIRIYHKKTDLNHKNFLCLKEIYHKEISKLNS